MNKKLILGGIGILGVALLVVLGLVVDYRARLLEKAGSEAVIENTKSENDTALSEIGNENEDFADFSDAEFEEKNVSEIDRILSDLDTAAGTDGTKTDFADFADSEAGAM